MGFSFHIVGIWSQNPTLTVLGDNVLFDPIDRHFWVPILSYHPLLQVGTTAEFSALGSSHNRTCLPNMEALALQYATWLKDFVNWSMHANC